MKTIDAITPPQKLLNAWRNRDLPAFKQLLRDGCDITCEFKEEFYQPILGAIARDTNNSVSMEFAEAILEMPNTNRDEQYRSGLCAIHHAAEISNLPVLTALIRHNADVNALDQDGSTALHFLVEHWKDDGSSRECIELLLNSKNIRVNIVNHDGYSAMHLAANLNKKEAVVALLEKGSQLDIDNTSVEGVTTRGAILEKFPELEPKLPEDLGPSAQFRYRDGSELFQMLKEESEEGEKRFCTALDTQLRNDPECGLLTYNNGSYTFLQYSSFFNKKRAVECLLRHKADPYYTPSHNKMPAMSMAAQYGYQEIVKMLLDASTEQPGKYCNETPLHAVCKYCYKSPAHTEILNMLLTKKWANSDRIDINAKDYRGNTALHYAVAWCDNDAILTMLQHGAYIGAINKLGESPIPDIPAEVFESFLDSKIHHKEAKLASKESFTFDCSFLADPWINKFSTEVQPLTKTDTRMVQETNPLLLMSRSKVLRHLLTHPVLTSFTYLKWQRIQAFFYLNLFFYLTLCILLSGYILYGFKLNPAPDYYLTKILIRSTIGIFLILLIFREVFQFVANPWRYIKFYENYIEILVVILSTYLIVIDCSQHFDVKTLEAGLCPQMSAIVVLLSWIQLVFLIGRHPQFAIQVEMFRKVSSSFLRFLLWYILIVIAFALSFFVLFRDCSGDCHDINPFSNEGLSIFKTLVMMTGEFEAGDIPLKSYSGTSHVLFTSFVFLIAMVLVNLLNGLAVADTKEILNEAYLYSCISRVELISFIEAVFLVNSSQSMKPVNSKCSWSFLTEYFAKKIAFFPMLLPDGKIEVVCRKRKNHIELASISKTGCLCNRYDLDKDTIKRAREISKGLAADPVQDDLGPKVSQCFNEIQQLAKSLKDIEKLLIEHTAI